MKTGKTELDRGRIAFLEGPEGPPARQMSITEPRGDTVGLWFPRSREA